MSDWTLGLVKARGLELEAYCPNKSCLQAYGYDLDTLIAEAGAGYRIADIPPLHCAKCGARLDIRLAMIHPTPIENEP